MAFCASNQLSDHVEIIFLLYFSLPLPVKGVTLNDFYNTSQLLQFMIISSSVINLMCEMWFHHPPSF